MTSAKISLGAKLFSALPFLLWLICIFALRKALTLDHNLLCHAGRRIEESAFICVEITSIFKIIFIIENVCEIQ